MARKNQKQVELKDCAKCNSVIEHKTDDGVVLYCRMMLKDANILQDSGIVGKRDCIWYKEKKK